LFPHIARDVGDPNKNHEDNAEQDEEEP